MPTLTLYHGTARAFDAFDPRYALRGSEPNSALGIHLTEKPWLAADYAAMAARDRHASVPCVLVVEVEIARAAVCSSATDYLGRQADDHFEATRPASDFVEARLRLESEGFEAVATDDIAEDLSGCWAVFDAGKLRIVGRITPDQALDLPDADVDGVEFKGVSLFEEGPAPSFMAP